MLGYTQPGGDLYTYFRNCVVKAGAKTGTAQLGGGQTNNGVFVCFAPYDDPQIAPAMVIEHGNAGAATPLPPPSTFSTPISPPMRSALPSSVKISCCSKEFAFFMSEPFVFDSRCTVCKDPFWSHSLRSVRHLPLPPAGVGAVYLLHVGAAP